MKSLRKISSAKHGRELYYLEGTPVNVRISTRHNVISPPTLTPSINSEELWHFCLRHLSSKNLKFLSEHFHDISYSERNFSLCDVCQYARQKRLPYAISKHNATKYFELVHFYIWGPFNTPSIHGHKYFLTVVDDHSCFTLVYLLKTKAKASHRVQDFVSFVKVHFNTRIKFI